MLEVITQWFAEAQHGIVWDALVVAGIFAGSVVFAFTLGRNSIIVSFVAVVFAGLVVQLLPSTSTIPVLSDYPEAQTDIATFAIAAVLFGFIFRRNRFFEPYIVPSGLERFVFAAVLAGLIVVILGSFWQGDTESVYVSQIFLHPIARLGWLLAPVVMLAIFRGDNA
ncbi:MAG: hypothetical protein AAB776_04250 [Patescibacteria group bacterium]